MSFISKISAAEGLGQVVKAINQLLSGLRVLQARVAELEAGFAAQAEAVAESVEESVAAVESAVVEAVGEITEAE